MHLSPSNHIVSLPKTLAMPKLTNNSTVALKSGAKMPVLGFGVYQSTAALASSTYALKANYKHIDSARGYRNESEVCAAVKAWKSSGGQENIWLTSKVFGREHGTKETPVAVDESVAKASAEGLKWDLYLLHDPTAGPVKRLEAWRVLEDAVAAGKLSTIGVSNFSEIHLEEFRKAGVKIFPEVNQIELHPWCQQKPIIEYCKAAGIVVQAYCPIVRGQRFSDPILVALSAETGKTPAPVLIRWSLQKGYVTLPKSDTPSRVAENADVFDFELSAEQVARLDALDEGAKGACSWNPVGHV